jgi:hypothetical protein
VAVVVLAVVFLAATARLFVWPPVDSATHTDAVVALGGDPGQRRAAQAVKLAAGYHVPVAVISLGGGPATCPRPPLRVQVICFRPNPVDTRGEAQYVARLVARRHWARIMVVPERSQTTRARLIFERCTGAHLVMVPVSDPATHLPYDVAYEWGALMKALIWQRSC